MGGWVGWCYCVGVYGQFLEGVNPLAARLMTAFSQL